MQPADNEFQLSITLLQKAYFLISSLNLLLDNLLSCPLGMGVLKRRDCNPGLEFSIPGFGIVEFPIPGSQDPVGIGVV